jgi:short-subunit dehydrogenase
VRSQSASPSKLPTSPPSPPSKTLAKTQIAAGALLAGFASWLAYRYFTRREETYEGQSVVISGGSRGLGLEMARQLARAGARITLLARDPDELEVACQELKSISPNICTLVCDVTQKEHFEYALAETRARFGSVDVLIHNAGQISVGPFAAMEKNDYNSQIDLHLNAAIDSIRAVTPYFRQSEGGRILLISSIGGRIPIPHLPAYCASKAALGLLAESVRPELAAENISITVAYPGLIRTGSDVYAKFRGDAKREAKWFRTIDHLPIITMAQEKCARRALQATLDRRASIIVGAPAKLADFFYHTFPETYADITTLITRALPKDELRTR